jgi:hypothetical protein
MKWKISTLRNFFFTICVIIPFFNNYEISFLAWIIAILFTFKTSYSKDFLFYLSHFILILLISFIITWQFEYSLYFIIRDITYMLKPILGLIIGYQFYKNDIKNPFEFLLKAGIAMATIHLILVSYGILIEGARNVREIRHYGGFFNDYEIYALVFLLFRKKLCIQITQQKFYLYLFILSLSAFFYLARTNFIQFFILTIALRGFLELNKKNLSYLGAILAITIISYILILWYNPKRNGPGVDEFLFKVKNAPIEAFSTKINRENWKDFHDNYRSYENIRTIQQLEENSSVWFGEGIGSQVDLKQKVYLGDMELRKISILHNGYMTVLLKSGIIGLLIYLSSILYFFKKYHSKNQELKTIHQIFIGTGVFLIISNWVFMGFYNPVDTKSLIIGFLFAYKFDLLKRNQN